MLTRILNLDPAFQLKMGNLSVPYMLDKQFVFPGGEVQVNLKSFLQGLSNVEEVLITHRIRNSEDVMTLLLATDAISERTKHVSLLLPYFPYGRQDREAAPGDAFSLRAFTKLINAQGYKEVLTLDPHSRVTTDLLTGKVVILGTSRYIRQVVEEFKPDFIVAPDHGAVTRSGIAATACGLPLVTCDKKRDTDTGHIIAYEVQGDPTKENMEEKRKALKGKRALIVDDICDGGATFLILAKSLRELGVTEIALWVSHGIFSKGVNTLLPDASSGKPEGFVDKIYTTNSIYNIPVSKFSGAVKQFDLTI